MFGDLQRLHTVIRRPYFMAVEFQDNRESVRSRLGSGTIRKGEDDPNCTTETRTGTRSFDGASVKFDEAFYQGEAYPEAFAQPVVLKLHKHVKDSRQHECRYAHTVVAHTNHRILSLRAYLVPVLAPRVDFDILRQLFQQFP